jgi:indole-3-glycerol phosphate synthase
MVMNRLEEILRVKRAEIERLRPRTAELERQAGQRNDFRSFRSALKRPDGEIAVIAEIKKASPSAGVIRQSFDPVEIVQNYDRAGADAISVLTDQQFFQGKLNYLGDVRRAVSLPLLRKDFILDEVQIAESAAAGADAILLIVAALEQKKLVQLREVALRYQVDVLIEVHTLHELKRALDAGAEIIGINNRDLITFDVDLSVTEKLSRELPDEDLLVSESGIKSAQDVARLEGCGVDAILVGEALIRGDITIEDLREA